MPASCSFSLLTHRPEAIAPVLGNALRGLGAPAGGGAVFLGGSIGRFLLEAAQAVKTVADGVPIIVAAGAGVMTERGEIEQAPAIAGIVWRGRRASAFALDADRAEGDLSNRVSTAATNALGGRSGAVLLFATRERVSPADLLGLDRDGPAPILFGGGTLGRPGAVAVVGDKLLAGDVVGLAIQAPALPIVRVSPACKLLDDLEVVTEADGALLLRLGSRSALEVLSSMAPRAPRGRVVVLVVESVREGARAPQLIIRGIRGVHERRAGLVISEDVAVGMRVGFATIDAAAARDGLEASLRQISRETRGGVPLFGLYIDCAGRGSSLHGEKDVDVELIRARWPGLPFAGIKSAFEIGPGRRGATTHLYSGVFALFHAPS